MRKLRLDVESVSVESFVASNESAALRGTVRAAQQEMGDGCTNWDTCDCPTAYYRCVEFMYTDYSCEYGTQPVYTTYC